MRWAGFSGAFLEIGDSTCDRGGCNADCHPPSSHELRPTGAASISGPPATSRCSRAGQSVLRSPVFDRIVVAPAIRRLRRKPAIATAAFSI